MMYVPVLLSVAIVEDLELISECKKKKKNELCDLCIWLELYTRILLRCTDP
jgi:hypothetical protein